MSDNESDTDRLADPFETDESSHLISIGQTESGATHPKNTAESDGDSPDGEGEGGSSQ
jgi:hypothetical protein